MVKVNAQLKGHLRGALNHDGVTVENVRAVRDIAIQTCEAAGMRRLSDDVPAGWGWRGDVVNV
jgi:alkylhydroperoxidase/carboxymuconolactone decarboxylase family protein YurZ